MQGGRRAHFRLGTLYRKQGKTDEAKQHVELYLRFKQMREKLQKVIHNLRVISAQDADRESGSKPLAVATVPAAGRFLFDAF